MVKGFDKGQPVRIINGGYKGAIGTVLMKHTIFFPEGSYMVRFAWEGTHITSDYRADELEDCEEDGA